MVKRYKSQKEYFLRRSNWAQAIALLATAVTPVLVFVIHTDEKIFAPWLWVPAAVTAVATIAQGALAAFKWQESWIQCGYAFHRLEDERFLSVTRAGDYARLDDGTTVKHFADRIHHLVMEEVAGMVQRPGRARSTI